MTWFTASSFGYQPCQNPQSVWSSYKNHMTRKWVFFFLTKPMVLVAHWRNWALPELLRVHSFVGEGEGHQHFFQPAWRWVFATATALLFHCCLSSVLWEKIPNWASSWPCIIYSSLLSHKDFKAAVETQGWQFKVTLLCLSCCKHWKRGVAMCLSGLLGWIMRCFWMRSSYNGIWGCYSVVNSVNNRASLKAFQSLHNNFGFGLGERLAAIIHVSTLLGRLAVEECQVISFGLF